MFQFLYEDRIPQKIVHVGQGPIIVTSYFLSGITRFLYNEISFIPFNTLPCENRTMNLSNRGKAPFKLESEWIGWQSPIPRGFLSVVKMTLFE